MCTLAPQLKICIEYTKLKRNVLAVLSHLDNVASIGLIGQESSALPVTVTWTEDAPI